MKRFRNDDEYIWCRKFGDKLQRSLHIKGITQGEFAAKLGVTEATLSRYINGVHSPSVYKLSRMAEILECDMKYLLSIDN